MSADWKTCAKCGLKVQWRKVGTNGSLNALHPGAEVYGWASRRGTKPAPTRCRVSDPQLGQRHSVEGQSAVAYRSVDGTWLA